MGLQTKKKATWCGAFQESHIYVFCLSLWLSDLSNLFAFSITHLWILKKKKKPHKTKSDKSVKILEGKKRKKSKESGAEIEMALLSSQHRICFGENGIVSWQFRSVVQCYSLRLISQLVMNSFTVVLKVPYIPINAQLLKLADTNSHSSTVQNRSLQTNCIFQIS